MRAAASKGPQFREQGRACIDRKRRGRLGAPTIPRSCADMAPACAISPDQKRGDFILATKLGKLELTKMTLARYVYYDIGMAANWGFFNGSYVFSKEMHKVTKQSIEPNTVS